MMSHQEIETSKAVVDDALEQLKTVAGYEIEIARDNNQYSVWLAAFATGGLALLLAKGSDFIDASWLWPCVARWFVIAAMIVFSIAMVLSAVVQRAVVKYRELSRTITAVQMVQRAIIICDNEALSKLTESAEDRYRLAIRIADGEFIPKGEVKDEWDMYRKQFGKSERCYQLALGGQQILVGVAYLLVVVAVIPFGHQPI